jgi:hypothetical protein
MDNQRIIQSTPAIFKFKSWTTDVVITVEKVSDKHVLASYLVVKSHSGCVDCNERWLYSALIIHCVDFSVAESNICQWIGVESDTVQQTPPNLCSVIVFKGTVFRGFLLIET